MSIIQKIKDRSEISKTGLMADGSVVQEEDSEESSSGSDAPFGSGANDAGSAGSPARLGATKGEPMVPRLKLSLHRLQAEKIQDTYKFGKHLGKGAYGQVKVAYLRSNPKKKFAIKSVYRSSFDEINQALTSRENKGVEDAAKQAEAAEEGAGGTYEELESEL